MDDARFDDFLRSMVVPDHGLTRRAFAGALLAVLAVATGEDADARKKRRKKRNKRSKNKQCKGATKPCGGRCIPEDNCCRSAECGDNAECTGGACSCLNGFEPCQGDCVPEGDCCAGIECPDGAACDEGICVCSATGEELCGGRCTDVATDAANCGACDAVCGTGVCANVACACAIVDDCPAEGCACGARKQGGFACFRSGSTAGTCDTDDDCPLGSFCAANGFCLPPCLV